MISLIYNQLQNFVPSIKNLDEIKPANETVVSLGLEAKDFCAFQNQLCQVAGIAPASAVDFSSFFQQCNLEILSNFLITLKQMAQKPGVNPEYQNLIQVAVVGIALRLPGGINTVDKYWKSLESGRFCISPTGTNRLLHHNLTHNEHLNPGEHYIFNYCRYDSTSDVSPITDFDPLFFNMNPSEATVLDPKFRWVLETTYEAFQDAGINPDTLSGTRTNVYTAPGQVDEMNTYTIDASPTGYSILNGMSMHSCAAASLPGRISFMYNLYGAAHTVDTACSSGLVATHDAFKDLNIGETDLAIVNAAHCPFQSSGFSLLSIAKMVSRNCRCAAYDEAADGYVPGEGCVSIILKRKDDAIRDHNKIYGLINATAVGQSGSRASMSTPSAIGQKIIHEEVLKNANLTPKDIDYMEGHGTGTKLGDRIEGEAINEVFKGSHSESRPLTLASVKTNIGHTEEVSGLASLVKVLLAMKYKTIPPHLHFHKPSSSIDFDSVPLHIPTQKEEWKAHDGKNRIALVSSYGLSGSVCDAVVEEYVDPEVKEVYPVNNTYHVLTISAKNNTALTAVAEQYITLLESLDKNAPIADLCYTSNVGRQHFNYRYAVAGRNASELAAELTEFVNQNKKAVRTFKEEVGMSFTGQGSIKPGVGQELFRSQPVFHAAMEKCDAVVKKVTGVSIIDALYDQSQAHHLKKAQIAQPALFAYEYAMCMLWKSWGVEPVIVNGHSLGEIVAAAVTGAIDIDLAIDFIIERARCMGEYGEKPGAMVSIFQNEKTVKEAIEEFGYEEEVAIAAINGVTHTVISGYEEEVDDITQYFSEMNIKTKKLNVTDAFHSPLMDPAIEELNNWIEEKDDAKFRQSLKVKFISNLDGTIKPVGDRLEEDYWAKHARNAVRFVDGVKTMIESEKNLLAVIEVGPAATLSHMSARFVRETESLRGTGPTFIASSVADQNGEQYLFNALCKFYMLGGNIDWASFHKRVDPVSGKTLPLGLYDLPLYPFQRSRYWLQTEEECLKPINKNNSAAHWDLYKSLTIVNTGKNELVVTAPLTPQYVKYLWSNHIVMGVGCVPAAAYTEFIIAATRAMNNGSEEPIEVVDELLTRGPLNIKEDSEVDFILKKRGERLALYTKVDGGMENHMLNAQANLLSDSENPNIRETLPTPEKTKALIKKVLTEDNVHPGKFIYDNIKRSSLYKGGFPSVKNFGIGYDDDGTFVLISHLDSVDRSINNTRSGLNQVYLFDATLHCSAGKDCLRTQDKPEENEPFLPSSFENLVKFKQTPDECYVVHRYLKENAETDPNSEFTSFTVFDIDGNVCEHCSAFQTRRVKFEDKKENPEYEIYSIDFKEVSTVPQEILTTPYFYLIGDHHGYADAFIKYMNGKVKDFHYVKIDMPTKETCTDDLVQQNLKDLGMKESGMENETLVVVNFMGLDLERQIASSIDIGGDAFAELLRSTYESNLTFIQCFTRVIDEYDCQKSFCFISKNGTDYWKGEVDVLQGIISGISKSYWKEFPFIRTFDLDIDYTTKPEELCPRLYTEAISSVNRYNVSHEVIYTKEGLRYEGKIKRVVVPTIDYFNEVELDSSGTVLITGGTGGVGFDICRYLVKQANLKGLVLTGRRPETDEKVAGRLAEIRALNPKIKITYVTANVGSEQEMKKVFDDINSGSPEEALVGVIHTAGTNDDGLIFNQSYERFAKLINSKIEGALCIAKLTEGLNLKFTILFSSMTAFFGNRGQINYCTANMFLNKVCQFYRSHNGRKDIMSLELAAWPSGLSSIIKDDTFMFNEINSINLISNLLNHVADIPAVVFGGPVINWNRVYDSSICDPIFRAVRPADRPRIDWRTANDSEYVKTVLTSGQNSSENIAEDAAVASDPKEISKDNIFEIMETELKRILQYGENDEIDPYQSLTELGIDSLMMMEFRTILKNVTTVNIPLVVFSTQNICLFRLVEYVKGKLSKDEEEEDKEKANVITEEEKKAKEAEEQKAKEEEAKLIRDDQVDQWITAVPGCEDVEDPLNVFIFFPSAEEGEIDYSSYVEEMEDSLLFTINLPGYGERKGEAVITDWDLLVKNVTKVILQTAADSEKFKQCNTIHFVGNGFGALLAWKTLLQIQIYEDEDKDVPIISTLIISRVVAPTAERPIQLAGEVISKLPPEGIRLFLEMIGSKVDFEGEKAYLLPIIHNEYAMMDSVTNENDMKIRSKLLVLSGKQDKIINENNTSLWKKEVSDEFSEFTQHIKMRGDHWFMMKDTTKYLKNIMENLD
jgi:acyl transferase domain-containing protein/surfactin synthase thioesterase subunit/NADP-dependent 3-hydroxy acid dehydrogenase YdfG/acyl carrier protein